jgi:para-aminobenzoate synthetase component 1
MPITALPYYPDSTVIFTALRSLPFSCWLDSGKPKSTSGRYDIMSAAPSQRWISKGGSTEIHHYQYADNGSNQQPTTTETSTEAPLALIKKASDQLALVTESDELNKGHQALPFSGGIIAYFSYELGRKQLSIAQQSPGDCALPDMVAGLYQWAVIQDHQLHQCFLISRPACDPSLLNDVLQRLEQLAADKTLSKQSTDKQTVPFRIGELTSNTSAQRYHQKIARINDYITAGDCYQVNFSQCFSADYQGDPYAAYIHLRSAMASPFSAFMDIGTDSKQQAILSLSPERLLQTQAKHALTQPIKGTIARDQDSEKDKNNAQTLQASSKNRAENVMIVDLLRNDLGKNCIPGSIKVPALCELESFPNVHHLVSSVTGIIAEEKTAFDVFQGCFPGGSITGAPKKRAMEIIEELEDCQRSIYCGSIAYINANGDMDSNITIRTIACDGEKLYCWGGGGIVADSKADEEYEESLTKIDGILRVLEEFRS